MSGINKCVSALKFKGITLFVQVWTGIDWSQQSHNGTYKCIADKLLAP